MDELQEAGVNLVCPVSGELIEPDDFDAMAACLMRIKAQQDRLYDSARTLKEHVASLAKGETRTKYVRGERYEAEVTAPDVAWSKPVLKDIWETAPEKYRDEILRVSEVAVNMRAWKVWEKTDSTDEDFQKLKRKIGLACLGRQGNSSVKITEIT